MKRVGMALVSLGLFASTLAAPALAEPAGACSYDYVISTKTLTATKLANERAGMYTELETRTSSW